MTQEPSIQTISRAKSAENRNGEAATCERSR